METSVQSSAHSEHFQQHELSNPSAPGLCPEMLEVAEEACRAGDFDLAVEIYSSQLTELRQPDRGLCLRKADALTKGGRIPEALDSYRAAAQVRRLRPEELGLLVESIARAVRLKELGEGWKPKPGGSNSSRSSSSGGSGGCNDLEEEEHVQQQPLDLFSCHICRCLLVDPTTLECGHTFCKRCLEEDPALKQCKSCCLKMKVTKVDPSSGFRLNVVLSGLLEKWFEAESKSRRCWMEGESLWKKQELSSALEKYNKAVELAPSTSKLLAQRAELHMDMKNFSQAIQDGDSMCWLQPTSAKAHYIKAKAIRGANRREEALQELLYCVALKSDWASVKMEAQKVLCEMFSSVFEDDGLDTPLHPLQATGPNPRIKPLALLDSLHSSLPRDGARAGCSKDSPLSSSKACDVGSSSSFPKPDGSLEDSKSLAAVLSSLPVPAGLKRKSPGDANAFGPPSKLLKQDPACSSQTPVPVSNGRREVPSQLLDSSDMECSLCMRLFYEPVTTPCGHTFCLKCLERCLDHNPNCPLCKENLAEYLATRGYNKTFLMEEVLQRYLSEELEERRKVHEEEMKELSNLNLEVPIFVCTMAFPTIPCPLHVFEPRYRLMIRRAMETGTKQFGMCISDELKGFADFGCMLEVRDVKFFPDGRSVVDTIGVSRFKVLSHGQRDGYNTAKIEYLEDKKVEGEELTELLKLHDSVYDQATAWFTSLKDNMKSQILSHFGHLPSKDPDPQGNPSGPAWCWWLLAVLPLESRAQLTILAMTSLKDRLIAIRRVLIFVTRKRPR
ncbi:LON peptidase N-terminal domain and RING finger protein 2 [Astyanax mexicanus]|uniref:LON peptidase N-terminal domain and RING finger protein 2 n=1 Tax=Astyanax mexicanus TaxID=7994 RepID=UPI0020CA9CDA|nr:LON peptidase N-terminal domain and RING finger protein 2 [Astyanax mexicanus]